VGEYNRDFPRVSAEPIRRGSEGTLCAFKAREKYRIKKKKKRKKK
jgi:hypothetical protein